jgi:hypothetical protein
MAAISRRQRSIHAATPTRSALICSKVRPSPSSTACLPVKLVFGNPGFGFLPPLRARQPHAFRRVFHQQPVADCRCHNAGQHVADLIDRFILQIRSAQPGEIAVDCQGRDVAKAQPTELRLEVVLENAAVAVLGAFGHRRHDNRRVGAVHEFIEGCCGSDGNQTLIDGPEELGR